MQAVLIQLCVFALFVQISSEQLNNDSTNNKLIKNVKYDLPPTNNTEPYKQCIINGLIRKIEEILRRQIKESESQIKSALKPQVNDFNPNVRKVRKTENAIDWDKCASKLELEQHRNLETEHILAIKRELGKLQELVRLLRDQQLVLNMLTDVDKPRPKIDDEDDQKQLLELFKMLKNNLPAQTKIGNEEIPFPPQNLDHNDLQKVMMEISKLQKEVENQNMNHETKLKTELSNQKMHLQALESEIESLRNGQAMFINVNPNKTMNVVGPDIVGAQLIQNHPLLAKLQSNTSARKSSSEKHSEIKDAKIHKTLSSAVNPKIRAGNDDFLENLQKLLLDNSEQSPEIKENPLDINVPPTSDIETRLDDLEKQLKISQKMKQLEKKIKQMHQSNAESKNIDDEDDIKTQLKKLQRQLNNMNKNKAESKNLDEEDVLDELKNLQSAINDLKPKEDESQSKIGGAEIQLMLNKLIGVPARPVVPVATQSQLTPAQIQVLRRIMALKVTGNHHQPHVPNSVYGHGVDGSSGYGQSGIAYNPAYSGYGQSSNGFYEDLHQAGIYSQGLYDTYDNPKQFYSTPSPFYPGYEENQYTSYGNGPYGPSLYGQYPPYGYPNKYGYSINSYSSNTAYGPSLEQFGTGTGKGGYTSNSKYGQNSNIAQYLFGTIPHTGNGQYRPSKSGNNYHPKPYAISNGVYGQHGPSSAYYGAIPHQQYAPKIIYAGSKVNGGLYRPPAQYTPGGGGFGYNKYDGTKVKPEPGGYPKPYGPKIKYEENGVPQSNGYEEQQFFRGYKGDEFANYGSDSSQFYSNPQENSYADDSYAQQKMAELQTQIYTLQNVINNLNSPEYVQKPEDQQTIYELDRKITDLKGVVNNLAQDTHQAHYEHGYSVGYGDEGVSNYRSDSKVHDPEDGHNSRRTRFRRDAKEVNNSTTPSVMAEFIQELSDVVTVINFLSESLSEVYNNRTVRDTSKISAPDHIINFLKMLKEAGQVPREANNSDGITNTLYQRLDKLMNFVDSLTDKMVGQHKTCVKNGNCADSSNQSRNKRDTEDSDDVGRTMQRIWDAMGALLGNSESEPQDGEHVSNEIGKEAESKKASSVEIHNQRLHLQQQLDNLKQQLDNKLRANSNSHSFGQRSQTRSSYYKPMSYYQPQYYHQPYYSPPIYSYTVYDYDEKEKKDKTKLIKLKKDFKVESKFDKIFTKILEKILDKIVSAVPIVIRKLLGLEFDFFGKEVDSYGYGDGYGVQKKKKFGIFSIIPMLIFKIFTNISYFVKKLKKNSFIKTFLVPGLVTVGTAGLVVFLVWWLTGDDGNDYTYYGYGGNIDYDNSYRNSINSNAFDDDYNNERHQAERSRSSQNFAKPRSTDYSSYNNEKKPYVNYNPYPSFYKTQFSKRYEPFIQKSNNFKPIRYY